MSTYDLSLHWPSAAGVVCGAVVAPMVVGSGLAVYLRLTARTEGRRALARDVGARAIGWWMVVLTLVPAVLAGGALSVAFFGLAALVAWHEFAGLSAAAAFVRRDLWWRVLLVLAYFGPGLCWREGGLWVGLALTPLVWLASRWVSPADGRAALWRATGWLVAVVPLGTAALVQLRFGLAWLGFVLVIAQFGDVLQYTFGKVFGRHLLAPKISPRKTWEGLVGGLLATALIGLLLAPRIHQTRTVGFVAAGLLGLAGALAGLGMSAAKRRHGAKNFGHWLPGHGGVLDRFDSLGGAALAAYAWLAWIGPRG